MSKITVIKSTKSLVASKDPAKKPYPVVELVYKTEEGKTKSMKIFGFGAQQANSIVAGSAKQGDVLDVVFQQSDKGYGEFASVQATTEVRDVAPTSEGVRPVGAASPRTSNWETSEERATRQVLIVRQNSVSNAVAYFDAVKGKPNTAEVIAVAKEFEAYVLGTNAPSGATGEVE